MVFRPSEKNSFWQCNFIWKLHLSEWMNQSIKYLIQHLIHTDEMTEKEVKESMKINLEIVSGCHEPTVVL